MAEDRKEDRQGAVAGARTWTSVQLATDMRDGLMRIAAQRKAAAGGKFVSIRALVEEALRAHFGDALVVEPAEAAEATVSKSVADDAFDAIFERIVSATYADDDPLVVRAAIEALEGAVAGSSGQQIKLRDLAYFYRDHPTALDLGALVRGYENG